MHWAPSLLHTSPDAQAELACQARQPEAAFWQAITRPPMHWVAPSAGQASQVPPSVPEPPVPAEPAVPPEPDEPAPPSGVAAMLSSELHAPSTAPIPTTKAKVTRRNDMVTISF